MKKHTWKRHHKWLGLFTAFFVLMFCISGIILNHRELVAGVNIDRRLLPKAFRFEKWNNGLLKGTLKVARQQGTDSLLLLYGRGGVWQMKAEGSAYAELNAGLPPGQDYRNVRAVVQTPDGQLWCCTPFGLYVCRPGEAWRAVGHASWQEERLSDLTLKGDTLMVVGRSHLYMFCAPYTEPQRITLKRPQDDDGRVSLFRTVWLLHSGELFGLPGRLLVDAVGVVLAVLCLTGILYWCLPGYIRRRRAKGLRAEAASVGLRLSFKWHKKLGIYTLGLLLFVAFTGWCLRPPVLIALVKNRVPAVPFTQLDSDNAWNDRLRMLRFDEGSGLWLLSTSEGMYRLSTIDAVPMRAEVAPPVSVMGINAWEKRLDGSWVVGSFSGMFVWNVSLGTVTDYFTGEPVQDVSGPPFGRFAVSGYTGSATATPAVVEYYAGTDALPMPQEFKKIPMSLWNLALEVHTGRIYTVLGQGTLVYIFFAGLLLMWVIISGYALTRKPSGKSYVQRRHKE